MEPSDKAIGISKTSADRGIVDIRLEDFDGGVGMWGAVPAGYDTTHLPMDRGIHVHARSIPDKGKAIDKTYSAVRVISNKLPEGSLLVSEVEAIYYMVSTVFGITPKHISCPGCKAPHLDRDWYCVNPHQSHVCENCGQPFETSEAVVCNPIVTVRKQCQLPPQQILPSTKVLDIQQQRYANGLLIWGSNPAFLWTGQHSEQKGMHVHVFGDSPDVPELDETYGQVRIDGIEVNAEMVRLLMAQQSLPMLRGQVAVVTCTKCKAEQFDVGPSAYTPTKSRTCVLCGHHFTVERELISNPVLATFQRIGQLSQRQPQHYVLDLPACRPVAA